MALTMTADHLPLKQTRDFEINKPNSKRSCVYFCFVFLSQSQLLHYFCVTAKFIEYKYLQTIIWKDIGQSGQTNSTYHKLRLQLLIPNNLVGTYCFDGLTRHNVIAKDKWFYKQFANQGCIFILLFLNKTT